MFTAQFDEFRRDVSYALRVLRRTPAFTATVVLTLGVSIGATTAMLTVFHGVLIQRLPVRDQDRIVVLGGVGGGTASDLPLEFDQYRRFRDASRTIQDAAGVVRGVVPQAIVDGDLTFSLTESLVTGNFFRPCVPRAFPRLAFAFRQTVLAVPTLGFAGHPLGLPGGFLLLVPVSPLGKENCPRARSGPGFVVVRKATEFQSSVSRLSSTLQLTFPASGQASGRVVPFFQCGRPLLLVTAPQPLSARRRPERKT